MFEIVGISSQALLGQLVLGLVNGSFYAMLSLGLALIFGMLHIINFAHGAFYMLGSFATWLLMQWLGVNYWLALVLAPLMVGVLGVMLEKAFISRLYSLNHLFGLLFTFGLALFIEGTMHEILGGISKPYSVPEALQGALNLGFMYLPTYRGWVIVFSLAVCLTTWFVVEKTKLGSYLRAATENPALVEQFGINVPLLITLTYGAGVALAALSGVLAAPLYQVNPHMGVNLMITVFAVVVIGGMGSLGGAIITGFMLGIAEGLTKVFYPPASNLVIFVVMALVLVARPNGLFGK
ncbi:branched-chain amino acid ABC transporter permease [Alcanivorax sp. 24]|uniref:branched-chain amino acid ABC transporter permease n=1 Tax=Alcanivorax sp. 24 TaxID=2545266 RepID=UPI00105EC08A|nr:branched-chain amino acid ABC transporter permease [Alcanivorax sp. 24]